MKIKKLVLLAVLAVILGMFCACEGGIVGIGFSQSDTPYTVSFEANGGTPAPQTKTIINNHRVTEPPLMTKTDYYFAGWYKEAAFNNLWDFNYDYVTQNTTLYAKWGQPVTVNQGTTLLEKLQWLASNAESYGTYILEINSNESLAPRYLSYGKKNITIQLIGIGGVRTIELNGSGSLFTISGGVTLVLNENIVLKGKANNNNSLIYVYSYSNLIMHGGTISGNTASFNYGGGVCVNGGTFTMTGGTISGNTAYNGGGGGVYVWRGTFTMTGGTISGNTVPYYGGGVYVDANNGGTFTMTGGIITGFSSDTVNGNYSSSSGHAVYYLSSMYRNTTAGQTDNIDTATGRGLSANGDAPFGQ